MPVTLIRQGLLRFAIKGGAENNDIVTKQVSLVEMICISPLGSAKCRRQLQHGFDFVPQPKPNTIA